MQASPAKTPQEKSKAILMVVQTVSRIARMKSLLSPVVSNAAMHPNFRHLLDAPTSAPTRAALEDLFQDFVDVDGTFVKEFQSINFDARVFELFLDCVFRFEGYRRNTAFNRPDFILSGRAHEFCVEAVTLNPTGLKPILPADLGTLEPPTDAEELDA